MSLEFNGCHTCDNYLAVLIGAGSVKLNNVLILTDLCDLALRSDGVTEENGCGELKLLTKVNGARTGKLVSKNRRDKAGCKNTVNDSSTEDSGLRILLIKVDGVGVKAYLCKSSEVCVGEGLLYGCLLSYVKLAECHDFFLRFLNMNIVHIFYTIIISL